MHVFRFSDTNEIQNIFYIIYLFTRHKQVYTSNRSYVRCIPYTEIHKHSSVPSVHSRVLYGTNYPPYLQVGFVVVDWVVQDREAGKSLVLEQSQDADHPLERVTLRGDLLSFVFLQNGYFDWVTAQGESLEVMAHRYDVT